MNLISRFFGKSKPEIAAEPTPQAEASADSPSVGLGRFFDAADQYYNSAYFAYPPRDFKDDAQKWDFDLIVSASRKLYGNSGIARIIDDKAMYSVGRAWDPVFTGKDIEWGKKATAWLRDSYYPIADVRGRNYDFKTGLHLDSVSMDRDGDFGKLLTETDEGFPQTQRIPSHRVSSGDYTDSEPLPDGPYKGLIIRQGVIYNRLGRPVAYGIKTDEGWVPVSARDLIHVFDPQWYDQGRGLPALTHALEDLKSLKKTQGFESMAMEILSNLGLIEENPEGMADPNDPANRLRPPSTPGNDVTSSGPVTTQTLFGGLIKYFKAKSGSKLSTLQHGRPGPNWESFWDRIIKGACVGLSWSYEVAWKLHTLGGATLRAALSKCNRAIKDRQDVLRPGAKQELQYAVAKAIKAGYLEESDEWYMWEFTYPPDLTVDMGREAAQQREDYKLFITSLHDILTPQGITEDEHMYRLAKTWRRRQEIAAETGCPVAELGQPPRPTQVTETIQQREA